MMPLLRGRVALNLSDRGLSLAYAPPHHQRFRRRRLIFSRPLIDRQSPADILGSAIREHRLENCFCVDALPYARCRLQVMLLPRLGDGELLRLVQRQDFWLDSMRLERREHHLWWRRLPHPQPHESRILFAAVPAKLLSERLHLIRAAGLHAYRLSLSCFDYCRFSDFSRPFCLLVLDEDDPVCLAIGDRGIEFGEAQNAPEASSSLAELSSADLSSQCAPLIQQLFAESPPHHIRIVAMRDEGHETCLNELRSRFPDCAIELRSPLSLCGGRASNFAEARAAARLLNSERRFFQSSFIDCRRPPSFYLRRRWRRLSALWIALTLLLAALLMHWHERGGLSERQWRDGDSLYQSSLDARREVERQLSMTGKELHRQRAWLHQLKRLKEMRGRLPMLLSAFEESAPQGLWLNRVNAADSSRVKIYGAAVSDRLANEFIGNLSAHLHPLSVEVKNADFSDNQDGTLRQFVLTVGIVDPTEQALRSPQPTQEIKR